MNYPEMRKISCLLPHGAVFRQYRRNFLWLTVMSALLYGAARLSAVVTGLLVQAVRFLSPHHEVLTLCQAAVTLLQMMLLFFLTAPLLMGCFRFVLPLGRHIGKTAHPGMLLDAFSSRKLYRQAIICGVFQLWMWGVPTAFLYAAARLIKYYAPADPAAAVLLTFDAAAMLTLLCCYMQKYVPVPFHMAKAPGISLGTALRISAKQDKRLDCGDELLLVRMVPSAALAVSCLIPSAILFCIAFPIWMLQDVLLFSALSQKCVS